MSGLPGPALAALCAALLGAVPAGAYPGEAEGAQEAVSLDGGLRVGEWSEGEGAAWSLTDPASSRNYLIPDFEGPSPTRVRARLSPASSADVALLFRTRVHVEEGRPPQIFGYGLSVDTRRGRVDFLRWDGLRIDDPGVRQRVRKLRGVEELEVVLLLSGPTFAALLYDGQSKELITSLAWTDATYAEGGVGLYAHRRTSSEVAISLSAGEGPAPQTPPRELAPEWLITVPDDAEVPASILGELSRLKSPWEGKRAYTGPEAAVRALEEGAVPHDAQPHVPFRFRDRGFERRSKAKIWRTRAGIRFLNGLKDPALVERHLVKYAERFPERVTLRSIGKSHEGRDIWALELGDPDAEPTRPALLLCAAHHANEPSTPEFALDAARWLLENRYRRQVRGWLKRFRIVIVPVVNPDGSYAFWHRGEQLGRTNRRLDEEAEQLGLADFGVDLNRNYPFAWGNVEDRFNSSEARSRFYRGPAAGSEPEVKAMMKLAEQLRPVAMLSFHGAATKILVPYTVEGAAEPGLSTPWSVAEEMIEKLPHAFGGKRYEAVRNLYPVGGVDQDWYFHRFGTLAYLVEVPANVPSRRRPLDEMLEHTRPAWQFLLQRFVDGPALKLIVVDQQGAPLEATVDILELGLQSDERWSTHPGTGVFYAYLPRAGSYTVRVRVGDEEQQTSFDAGKGLTEVSMELGAGPAE